MSIVFVGIISSHWRKFMDVVHLRLDLSPPHYSHVHGKHFNERVMSMRTKLSESRTVDGRLQNEITK